MGLQRSGCSFGQIRSAIFFDPLSAGWIPSKMMSRSLITQRGSTKVQFSTEFSQARARVVLRQSPASFTLSSRSEEHTSALQSRPHLVCRLLLEKKKTQHNQYS